MSLTSITKFFNYRPHLSNRFTCSLFVGTKGNEYLQFNVQSVNVTELESEASNAAVYFGNGYVTIPIINTASRKIEIVFEETNTMEVSYILDSIMADHFHGTPRVIAIGIKEYDDRFLKIHSARLYYCLLSSWEEPQFSRTGNPGIVTVSATFNVMSEEAWTGAAPKSGLGAVTVKQLADGDKFVEEKPPVAELDDNGLDEARAAKLKAAREKAKKTDEVSQAEYDDAVNLDKMLGAIAKLRNGDTWGDSSGINHDTLKGIQVIKTGNNTYKLSGYSANGSTYYKFEDVEFELVSTEIVSSDGTKVKVYALDRLAGGTIRSIKETKDEAGNVTRRIVNNDAGKNAKGRDDKYGTDSTQRNALAMHNTAGTFRNEGWVLGMLARNLFVEGVGAEVAAGVKNGQTQSTLVITKEALTGDDAVNSAMGYTVNGLGKGLGSRALSIEVVGSTGFTNTGAGNINKHNRNVGTIAANENGQSQGDKPNGPKHNNSSYYNTGTLAAIEVAMQLTNQTGAGKFDTVAETKAFNAKTDLDKNKSQTQQASKFVEDAKRSGQTVTYSHGQDGTYVERNGQMKLGANSGGKGGEGNFETGTQLLDGIIVKNEDGGQKYKDALRKLGVKSKYN